MLACPSLTVVASVIYDVTKFISLVIISMREMRPNEYRARERNVNNPFRVTIVAERMNVCKLPRDVALACGAVEILNQ